MAKKKYVSTDGMQYTFPVTANGKTVFISFRGCGNEYSTSDKEIQEALESTPRFLQGKISLASVTGEEGGQEKAEVFVPAEKTEFPDVNTPQEAREVLRNEPYNVPYQALTSPERIKAKADSLDIVFPNVDWR